MLWSRCYASGLRCIDLDESGVCPKELDYWRENTSIGFVFSLLTSMSFIVGVILVYQILYGCGRTLGGICHAESAISYSNYHRIVLQESVILVF